MSLTTNRARTSSACPAAPAPPELRSTAWLTRPSTTDSDSTSVLSRTSPPCRVTTSASARHSPIVPSGWKPNRLNALLRVK